MCHLLLKAFWCTFGVVRCVCIYIYIYSINYVVCSSFFVFVHVLLFFCFYLHLIFFPVCSMYNWCNWMYCSWCILYVVLMFVWCVCVCVFDVCCVFWCIFSACHVVFWMLVWCIVDVFWIYFWNDFVVACSIYFGVFLIFLF